MDSFEPRTRGVAASADSQNYTTHKRPGARAPARPFKEPGWLIVMATPAPEAHHPGWARKSSSRAAGPQRRPELKVSPTWQPRAGASVSSYHPWENPLYPRIPKAPKLPSEFEGTTPSSPSIAPEVFSGNSEEDELEEEPSMWPAVRRVWTWLRGSR